MEYFNSCPILNDIIKFCKTATLEVETSTGYQFQRDSSLVQFGYRISGRMSGTKRTHYSVTLCTDKKSYDFEISEAEYKTALRIIKSKELNSFLFN